MHRISHLYDFWILHGERFKNVKADKLLAGNTILNDFCFKLLILRGDELIYLHKPKVVNKGRGLSCSK